MLNTPSKETMQLLAAAANRIQLRQRARTASGWYFTLAAFVLLAALFHLLCSEACSFCYPLSGSGDTGA